jgi:superfamily I DNA/RNA helicase
MYAWKAGELNPDQEAAILEPGSVFLVSCPGSGKTRTLTYKIAHELAGLESDRQFVVAITYTHRAADEIQERIENLGLDTSRLWIGTIHSFCLEWILRPYGIYHPSLEHGFKVLDSHEREEILEGLCAPYKRPKITHWDCDYHFAPDGYLLSCPDARKHAGLHEILGKYFAILDERRAVDFELILFYAYEIVEKNPAVSKILSQIISLVTVDEYQDTKQIQYSIVASILRAGEGAVRSFVVGDPNQAIYKSLGGYPIPFKDFKAMAGIEMKELSLSKNYRSSERIIEYFGNFNVHGTLIEAASGGKAYRSLVSFDDAIGHADLEAELIRLIRHNANTLGIEPNEICVLAPQWVHLAGMTRRLVSSLPEYRFDGPGMVPFARDIDNFWYKLAKIALSEASPGTYVRRLRWAGEVLKDMEAAGVRVSGTTAKSFLRESNSVEVAETDGLAFLRSFYDGLFKRLGIDFTAFEALADQHAAFFASSQARIERLKKEGTSFVGDVASFRKVFQNRSGITVSTIHGVKGAEFDCVIAYGLLEDWVPHFSDPNKRESAMKMLYVVASRARKNLHLISERGRRNYFGAEYGATEILAECAFDYDVVP